MKVGFARIGQHMYLGDSPEDHILNETEILFRQLVNARPDWKWKIVTPVVGETDLKNVTHFGLNGANPDQIDDHVDVMVCFITFAWMMSQRIPKLNGDGLCTPLLQAKRAFGGVTRMINTLNDATDGNVPIAWVTTDCRSTPGRARDLKWPVGELLTQYDASETRKMFRYGDVRTPESLGFSGLVAAPDGHWTEQYQLRNVGTDRIMLETEAAPMRLDRPRLKGILGTNKGNRWSMIREFGIGTSDPMWQIRGKWPNINDPVLPPRLAHEQWRCTFMVPPDRGKGWPSLKPWEAYAAGTPILIHPGYDTQHHIPMWNREWQTVHSPEELQQKSDLLLQDDALFEQIATSQRACFETYLRTPTHIDAIIDKLERVH